MKQKEIRKLKIHVGKVGGNSGSTSKHFRISLPNKWVKEMGITPEERTVNASFDGEVITIEKAQEQDS